MPVRFFLDGYLGNLERSMQLVPHFQQRSSGRTKGCHCYTASDCDCSYCLHAPKPRMSCGLSLIDCPCLTERLETGCITAADLIVSLLPDIHSKKLRQRVCTLTHKKPERELLFENTPHRTIFNDLIRNGGLRNSANTGLLAAVFLLTSNSFLWGRARHAVRRSCIAFENICLRGITVAKIDSYAIYKAAKELYAESGKHHISIQELADETLVSENVFRLIVNGMLIKRYGLASIRSDSRLFS